MKVKSYEMVPGTDIYRLFFNCRTRKNIVKPIIMSMIEITN